jgi:hypothetical protein
VKAAGAERKPLQKAFILLNPVNHAVQKRAYQQSQQKKESRQDPIDFKK